MYIRSANFGCINGYEIKNHKRWLVATSASYLVGTNFISGVEKRPEPECNHSPPSSAELKNKWSYTSAPLVSLHVVNRDNLTFNFTFYSL